jgi:hypothetical protein
MTGQSSSLSSAFRRCVGELGMWSASRLFLRTARENGGDAAVDKVRESLGVEFPLLVMMALSEGDDASPVHGVDDVVARCDGLRRLVVVGLESDCLDPLLAQLPRSIAVALLLDTTITAYDERLVASWGDRVTRTDLADFQRHAGMRSALLTTVYGTNGFRCVVPRVWLRCHGDDVRTQFRHLIGWNVLPAGGLDHYPRWLVETDVADFTDVIGGAP